MSGRFQSIGRPLTVVGLWALFPLPAALGSTASAQETSSIESVGARSSVVVRGYVSEVEAHGLGPDGQDGIHTRVRLEVEQVLIGTRRTSVEFWVHGGRLGDQVRRVHGQPTFEVGEHVVVCLFRSPYGSLWPSAFNLAKWLVVRRDGQLFARAAQRSLSRPALRLHQLEERLIAGGGQP